MDAKRVALIVGIAVLLPLFIGLFMDAVYPQPEYNKYCNDTYYAMPLKDVRPNVNCSNAYDSAEARQCANDKGNPRMKFDENNCEVFDYCDMCSVSYNKASEVYNRNLFFILAPIGLAIVIVGLYLAIEYIGAGLMFAGLITMFYATMRYFSEMSKIWRAIIIFIELVIVVWIGIKKIGKNPENKRDKKKK
jgi:hypothetical protein